jgi:hypothetical protein
VAFATHPRLCRHSTNSCFCMMPSSHDSCVAGTVVCAALKRSQRLVIWQVSFQRAASTYTFVGEQARSKSFNGASADEQFRTAATDALHPLFDTHALSGVQLHGANAVMSTHLDDHPWSGEAGPAAGESPVQCDMIHCGAAFGSGALQALICE